MIRYGVSTCGNGRGGKTQATEGKEAVISVV